MPIQTPISYCVNYRNAQLTMFLQEMVDTVSKNLQKCMIASTFAPLLTLRVSK